MRVMHLPRKLNNFHIKGMALAMKGLAPDVWAMLDLLLMGDRMKCNLISKLT